MKLLISMLLLFASISIQAQVASAGETLRSWSDLQITTADLNAVSWAIETQYQPDTASWKPMFSFGDQQLLDDASQIALAKNVSEEDNVVFADFGSLRFSISIYSGTVFIYTPDGSEIYMKGGVAKQIKEYRSGVLTVNTSYEDDKYLIVINHNTGAVLWEPITTRRE